MSPAAATPPSGPERQRRVSAERLGQLADRLSHRDRAILTDLDRFGFLTTQQLQLVHFRGLQAAERVTRRVLKRLADDRLIVRVDRRVGGFAGGSSTTVWRLGVAGFRLLHDGRRLRMKEPSPRFLDHRLSVADCYVDLVAAAAAGHLELLTVTPEPESWRSYLGPHGQRETLKPDLFAVTASGDYEDHWFLEVDRGTESLPTVQDKCAQYIRYRRTGREQAEGGLFPAVLWVVPDARRARTLQPIATGEGADGLFRITTSANFVQTLVGGGS